MTKATFRGWSLFGAYIINGGRKHGHWQAGKVLEEQLRADIWIYKQEADTTTWKWL